MNGVFEFLCINDVQSVTLEPDTYIFEAWGASGGKTISSTQSYTAARGGYTSGMLKIDKNTTLFIYVGGKGEDGTKTNKNHKGGYNGGGDGGKALSTFYYSGSGGGGATDFRLSDSYEDRILIAGGGGGSCYFINGGYGGGLISGGSSYMDCSIPPSSQTQGNVNGIGDNGRNSADTYFDRGAEGNGGCGGGYRGGKTHNRTGFATFVGGSGGSSYISGNPNCVTYKNIKFYNTVLYSGRDSFPAPMGGFEMGHEGDGYARITSVTKGKLAYIIETRLPCTIREEKRPLIGTLGPLLFSLLSLQS